MHFMFMRKPASVMIHALLMF